MNFYTPCARPSFIEDVTFVSTIPIEVERIGVRYSMLIGLANLTIAQLGEQKLNLLKNLTFNSKLMDIADKDLLALEMVKLWEGKSRGLDKVRFLINNNLQIDQLKKVGSWEGKSGELLKKRGKIILSTLLLTLEPANLEELAATLGYKSKERYRDDYVKPLKDNQLISYTIPNNPNDPNQAYVITQRGKDFIGGHRI